MKVRTKSDADGRWVHLDDLKAALRDDALITDAAAVLKVGHERSHDHPLEVLRRCFAYALAAAIGEAERIGVSPTQWKPRGN